jgi:hypothetical protein
VKKESSIRFESNVVVRPTASRIRRTIAGMASSEGDPLRVS